jgi:hypothetical protein
VREFKTMGDQYNPDQSLSSPKISLEALSGDTG